MKMLECRLSLIILALFLISPVISNGEDLDEPTISTEKLDADILGIHLGCNLKELKEALSQTPVQIKMLTKNESKGITTYMFSGNHRLNGATATGFALWDGRLLMLSVYFKSEDASKLYAALKMKMEEKYGQMIDEISFGGSKCTLAKDGMYFELKHDVELFESDTVTLVAGHMGLLSAKEADSLKEKAEGLGDF